MLPRPSLSAARAAELPLRDVAVGHRRITVTIPLVSIPDPERITGPLALELPELSLSFEDYAQITAVGVGVGSRPERLAEALTRLGPPPLLTISGPLRVSSVIAREQMAEAEPRWHELFVEH